MSQPNEQIKINTRKAIASHYIATVGSKTECGGEIVTAFTGLIVNGYRVACAISMAQKARLSPL